MHIKSNEMEIATLKRAITTGFGSVYYPKDCIVEADKCAPSFMDRFRIRRLNSKGVTTVLVNKRDLKFTKVVWKEIK